MGGFDESGPLLSTGSVLLSSSMDTDPASEVDCVSFFLLLYCLDLFIPSEINTHATVQPRRVCVKTDHRSRDL